MKDLTNRKILFIICGGVSAYKSLETIRLFKKNNAEIKTILTKNTIYFNYLVNMIIVRLEKLVLS